MRGSCIGPDKTTWNTCFCKPSKKKFFLDKKSYDQMLKSDKEEYFAGGGTDEEYEKILKISNKIRNKLIKQLQNNEYSCCSGSTLYIIKGIKQK